jgi:3-(3-hydroxy-phenyl)propionate hydroxylase
MLGLESEGQAFRDRFLIADIHMHSDFPPERWFWFDPPFHPGQSVLLHRQADDVWRVDFQLGWDADPDEERKPERILPRLRAMLGPDARFEIEWASVYTFQCRRMKRFRHGRVLFAGDAAHLVSPFGARGANSGVQDADNLAWKLALVVRGRAGERCSTATTTSAWPPRREHRGFDALDRLHHAQERGVAHVRDAVLELAKRHPFARRLVNSGRLSTPAVLRDSPLNTRDRDADFPQGDGAMEPGAPAADAPVRGDRGPWLLRYLEDGFTLLAFGPVPAAGRRGARRGRRAGARRHGGRGRRRRRRRPVRDALCCASGQLLPGAPGPARMRSLAPVRPPRGRGRARARPCTRGSMTALNTQPNLDRPDELYARLLAAHRDLDDAQSAKVNAKLVLLLANHIGDAQVIDEAIAAAREDVVAGGER